MEFLTKEQWKFVSETLGLMSVGMDGAELMLLLCVDNWDTRKVSSWCRFGKTYPVNRVCKWNIISVSAWKFY